MFYVTNFRCVLCIAPSPPGDEEYAVFLHGTSFILNTSTARLASMMAAYAPFLPLLGGSQLPVHVYKQIGEAVQRMGAQFQRQHFVGLAVEASRAFVWPDEVSSRDLVALRKARSMVGLVKQSQSSRQLSRFNPGRVAACLQGVSNYDVVMDLATSDIVIDPLPGFRHQSSVPPLRPLMRTLKNCLGTHALKAWEEGGWRSCLMRHSPLQIWWGFTSTLPIGHRSQI